MATAVGWVATVGGTVAVGVGCTAVVIAIGRILAVGVLIKRTGAEVCGVDVGFTAAVGGATMGDGLVTISLPKFSVPGPPLPLAPEEPC